MLRKWYWLTRAERSAGRVPKSNIPESEKPARLAGFSNSMPQRRQKSHRLTIDSLSLDF